MNNVIVFLFLYFFIMFFSSCQENEEAELESMFLNDRFTINPIEVKKIHFSEDYVYPVNFYGKVLVSDTVEFLSQLHLISKENYLPKEVELYSSYSLFDLDGLNIQAFGFKDRVPEWWYENREGPLYSKYVIADNIFDQVEHDGNWEGKLLVDFDKDTAFLFIEFLMK